MGGTFGRGLIFRYHDENVARRPKKFRADLTNCCWLGHQHDPNSIAAHSCGMLDAAARSRALQLCYSLGDSALRESSRNAGFYPKPNVRKVCARIEQGV